MNIDVLDHGYIKFIEAWGHGEYGQLVPHSTGYTEVVRDLETGIIEAARQSTQGSFRGWDQDAKLLRHLFRNRPQHSTPFEFAGLIVEVQAPLFVFREWHRHRTQSYNEMSARYAPLPDLYYVPNLNNVIERSYAAQTVRNKQQAGTAPFNPGYAEEWLRTVEHAYTDLEDIYQHGLANGIPKDLARITMPVGHYSRMRASVNLRNWLAFMTLRDEEGVQWETREFAKAAGQIIAETFPRTWALYEELRADTKEAWRLWDEAQLRV